MHSRKIISVSFSHLKMSDIFEKYDSQTQNSALKLLTEFLHQYIKQPASQNHEFLLCVVRINAGLSDALSDVWSAHRVACLELC